MGSADLVSALYRAAINNLPQTVALALLVVPLSYLVFNEYTRYSARLQGFNGPSGLPLIGNIWDIRKNAAEQYRHWSKRFGAVYQVQLGNVPILVVNDAASAKVIFGHNSQALASRPEFYTFHKVRMPTQLVNTNHPNMPNRCSQTQQEQP
jgi:3-hydroxyphenylacetate 6-hydroxylase